MAAINVLNLADIYAKADAARESQQQMQLRDLQMQDYMQKQQSAKSLKDLVAGSYMAPQAATPFQTGGEEEFMGQQPISGLSASPATTGGMDYQKLSQGAAAMGDVKTAQEADSMFKQELWSTLGNTPEQWEAGKQELAQKYGPKMAEIIPPYSTGEADKLARQVLGAKEYMEHQRKADYTRALANKPKSAAASTIQAKIAAVRSLGLEPEEEADAIQAIVGARAKPGGRDASLQDDIAAYKAQFPMNPLTGKQPPGAPTFEEFQQSRTAAKPNVVPKVTPEGYEIIGQNPDGTLKIRDPKSGRTGTYKP